MGTCLGKVVLHNPRSQLFHDPGDVDPEEGPRTPEASAFLMLPHNSPAPWHPPALRCSQAQRATAQDWG